MRIESISVSNFRKLSNKVTIELDEQTIIVGKNNAGKTSVSEVMAKFLTATGKVQFEDYSSGVLTTTLLNLVFEEYRSLLTDNDGKPLSKEQYEEIEDKIPSISLELLISVEEDDNLADIRELLFEFNNNSKIIIRIKHEFLDLKKCIGSFESYNSVIEEKNSQLPGEKKIELLDFYSYFKRYFSNFFALTAFASKPGSEYEMPIDYDFVKKLFNVGVISAQREVDDTADQNSQSISKALWNYYSKITKEVEVLDSEELYKDSTQKIKDNLKKDYEGIFKELINEVNGNILINEAGIDVEIESEFGIEEILKRNLKLKYNVDGLVLPESYNGLGHSNLLYMFIQIITFKDKMTKEKKIFNVLFIEEPESHLHPQMQSTFLNKIVDILQCECHLNVVISTHSSYILQSSNLENIRYFLVTNADNRVKVKSLKSFFERDEYRGLKTFLVKYFKISTCDLFFADKAILVEGAVERMLMPVFKMKIDGDSADNNEKITKQHITTFEVGGAYAHKFYELLNFLEIKTLIITDVDSVEGTRNKKCKCDLSLEGIDESDCTIKTSNAIVKEWFNKSGNPFFVKEMIEEFELTSHEMREEHLVKNNPEGSVVRLTFQTPESSNGMCGRTFEEQFIIENSEYLLSVIQEDLQIQSGEEKRFSALIEAIKMAGGVSGLDEITEDDLKVKAFEIVSKIDKTNFSFDLLSTDEWIVPKYIEEGLAWLKR